MPEEERSAIGVENQKFLRDFDAESSQMEFHHLPQKPSRMEFHLVIQILINLLMSNYPNEIILKTYIFSNFSCVL